MTRLTRTVLTLGLLAGLAGPARAAEPIKIGFLAPMTGSSAAYGQMMREGVALAQAKTSQVLGRPVELLLADTRSDRVEAANAANRLIMRDQVVAILGPFSSSEGLAAGPVAEKARIPLLTAWGTNPLVTQGKRYVFRTCFVDTFQGQVAASFARHNLKAQTAAVLLDVGSDYSVGLAKFFQKSFVALGGRVVLSSHYSGGDQEFGPQLAAIKDQAPDLIFLPAVLPEVPLIVRQARELGLTQPIICGDSAQTEETLQIAGPASEGLYFTTHFDEQAVVGEAGKHYVREYRRVYAKTPDPLGAPGYDGYLILLEAMARAGSTDPEALVRALEQTRDFPGVCGNISIVGRDAVMPAVILSVKDGKFQYVATVEP